MKKILLIMLALTLSFALIACDNSGKDNNDDTPHTHTYSDDWTSDATSHWKICTGDGCKVVSDIDAHSFDEGTVTKEPESGIPGEFTYACTVCNATKTEEIPALPVMMSEVDWAALFAFENVRIDSTCSFESLEEKAYFLVDGENVAEYSGEDVYYTGRSALVEVDFSTNYSAFAPLGDGVYYAEAISVLYDDIMEIELSEIYLTVSNGKVSLITYTMDFGSLGTYEYSYAFSLWGEVTIEVPDTSITADMLAYAFSMERFDNVTFSNDYGGYEYYFDGDNYLLVVYDEEYNVSNTENGASEGKRETVLADLLAIAALIDVDKLVYDQTWMCYDLTDGIDEYPSSDSSIVYLSLSLNEDGTLANLYYELDDETVVSYSFYSYGETLTELE